jgi:hypothetical protein
VPNGRNKPGLANEAGLRMKRTFAAGVSTADLTLRPQHLVTFP